MIKLMKYLKRSAGYIVLIIALLFLQAYCDLSLPNYTSNIINVGIQQNGIEDSVPEKIRKTSMDSLKLFMEEDDAKTVDGFYEEEGDDLVLKDKISKEDREELNDIFGKPMVIVSTLTSDSEESKAALAKMGIPEGTDPLAALSQMPAEALAAMKEQVGEKIDKMQESIITQAGVSYVRVEYEAMGEDVDAIQMDYMKATGIRMVLMALVTMMAAVCVVFLSSRVAASMGHDLRGLVYNKVIGFSSREYHKFSTASLITRCTNDIQQIQQVMAMMFRIVLYAPILGIGGVIRVLQRDSSMTWILGVAIVLIMAFMGWHSENIFMLIAIVQIILVDYLVIVIVYPLQIFSKNLDSFNEMDFEKEEMGIPTSGIPFEKQVYRLVNQYAACKTRKNNAQILNKQTELTALQSQINPHFLYNTLECIRGQALIDGNMEIAKMVEALSAFFRYSISRKGNLVTLRDELANIENYMLIQRYRFNNRFSMEVVIDEEDEEAYNFMIPRLIIQPIVENAIFHGLEEKLEGGKVTIEVIVTDQNLILTISDNGKGMDSKKLKELNARIQMDNVDLDEEEKRNHRNTGIALPNIHKRIRLLFGEEYGVNVYSTVGQGTDVEITIPVNDKNSQGIIDEKRITKN